MLRERKTPGDKLRRTDEIERRSRQRWHVQRLANVASGIWAHSRPFKQESKAIHRPDLP
jgi:hypothetical protein